MTKSQERVVYAYNRGYRVDDQGRVIGILKDFITTRNYNGYSCFSVRTPNCQGPTMVHRLMAYQKYGDKIFDPKIQVRHLNGNSLDNSYSNIAIGTASENMMDKRPDVRQRAANYASSFVKKHNHELVAALRKEGKTYKQIMEITGISSKGTVSFIARKTA